MLILLSFYLIFKHLHACEAIFLVLSSQDMFDQYQAQRWWEENYDDVMELYNVQRFNHQAMPLPTPPRSEDEVKKGCALGCSASDSLGQHKSCRAHYNSSGILTTTPKLSSISGSKTETSSTEASTRASSSPKELDQSEEIFTSVSHASDMEREWVEEDVPGVYITIRELPGGIRELCRVRFRSVFHHYIFEKKSAEYAPFKHFYSISFRSYCLIFF